METDKETCSTIIERALLVGCARAEVETPTSSQMTYAVQSMTSTFQSLFYEEKEVRPSEEHGELCST